MLHVWKRILTWGPLLGVRIKHSSGTNGCSRQVCATSASDNSHDEKRGQHRGGNNRESQSRPTDLDALTAKGIIENLYYAAFRLLTLQYVVEVIDGYGGIFLS